MAIVGSTGCGKSTLVRLLLGFEQPQAGTIYYDERPMGQLNLKSLRSRIGTVLQDGKLFIGDIYSNISLCKPGLTEEEAWEAARMAGIDEDIRRIAPNHFLLVPGVGAQGGSLQEVCRFGMTPECGLLVNSSRGIIYASSDENFAEIAGNKARQLQQEMAVELENIGF